MKMLTQHQTSIKLLWYIFNNCNKYYDSLYLCIGNISTLAIDSTLPLQTDITDYDKQNWFLWSNNQYL